MGRRFAILGDIHANIDALNVVLEDCRAQGVTDYLCTGDIVGYNAAPHECLEAMRALNCPIVMGNHDFYVSSRQNLEDLNPNAAAGIQWTRKHLTMDDVYFLRSLPFVKTVMGMTLVHSTMDSPENFGYVFDPLQAEASFSHQITPICFNGHTHCPRIYEKTVDSVMCVDETEFTLPIGRKYFINVGSVGQPRDRDPRASYVVYDVATRHLTFRRLEYNIVAAQNRILQAGLPIGLAERLMEGR